MTRVIESPAAFVVLAFLYPVIFLFQQNSHLYQPSQIVATFVCLVLVAVCLAAIVSWLVRPLRPAGQRAAMVAVGAAVLLTLLYSPISAVVRDRMVLVSGYLIVIGAAAVLGYLRDVRVANAILIVLCLFNGGVAVVRAIGGMAVTAGAAAGAGTAGRAAVTFERTPNVYLVVLESYNSLEVRERTYGIDNAPLLKALAQQGFTLYDRVYANYWATVFSLSPVFSTHQHYYENSVDIADGGRHRKVIGGVVDNPVLETFAANGYAIDYTRFNSALYHPGPLLDRYEPQPLLQPMELLSGVYSAVYRLTTWDMWHSPAFQAVLFLPNTLFSPGAGNGPPIADGRPVFSLIYTGAEHAGEDNAVDEVWVPRYRSIVAKSDPVLIELLTEVHQTDPGALVVLLGDHGGWRTRDRWMGDSSDPNVNLRAHGVSAADATRDLFEVLMAVKWPKGAVPPGRFSPVNLFREVFASLAGDPAIRDARVPDDSFAYVFLSKSLTETPRVYRTVKDGQLLDRWEPFTVPPVAGAAN
jgi:hypothetical protein